MEVVFLSFFRHGRTRGRPLFLARRRLGLGCFFEFSLFRLGEGIFFPQLLAEFFLFFSFFRAGFKALILRG